MDARISVFLRNFDKSEAQIREILQTAIQSRELYKVRERRRQQAEAQAIIREVFKISEKEAQDLLYRHFNLGRDIAQYGIGKTFLQSEIQKQTLTLLTDNLASSLDTAKLLVGRRVDDAFRKEALRASLEKAQGEVTAASATATRRLQQQGVTAFIDRSGRQWTLAHYVQMAVDTTSSQAQNTATRLVLVEQGFDVVRINAVRDPCNMCVPYNGKDFSLTGRSDVPLLKEMPPFHPSCRHFMYPTIRTVQEKEQSLLEVI